MKIKPKNKRFTPLLTIDRVVNRVRRLLLNWLDNFLLLHSRFHKRSGITVVSKHADVIRSNTFIIFPPFPSYLFHFILALLPDHNRSKSELSNLSTSPGFGNTSSGILSKGGNFLYHLHPLLNT